MNFRIALIGFALVTAVGCGSSSSPAPTPTPTPSPNANDVTIVSGAAGLTDRAYTPNPITIAVGGSVTWMNGDTITHTATSDTAVWNSGALAPGGSFTATFPTAGKFPYHCTIHPGMIGTVTVQ